MRGRGDEGQSQGESDKVTINVVSEASPDPLEVLRAEVEARCPVRDNIASATPVNIVLSKI